MAQVRTGKSQKWFLQGLPWTKPIWDRRWRKEEKSRLSGRAEVPAPNDHSHTVAPGFRSAPALRTPAPGRGGHRAEPQARPDPRQLPGASEQIHGPGQDGFMVPLKSANDIRGRMAGVSPKPSSVWLCEALGLNLDPSSSAFLCDRGWATLPLWTLVSSATVQEQR